MNKETIFGVIVFGILATGVYFGYQAVYPKPISRPVDTTSPLPSAATVYTLDQISEHASKESCYLAIEGKVYDMTPFVASGFHPGKEAILQGCGKDATELFNTRPMGSGTAHSERARSILPKYYIGELVQS